LVSGISIFSETLNERRKRNIAAHTDTELYSVFDITYDYDLYSLWLKAIDNPEKYLNLYLNVLKYQDTVYPPKYIKMRFVENHDKDRIAKLLKNNQCVAWTAFCAFNKGCFQIYAGQECGAKHRPSLFEKDLIKFTQDHPLQAIITKLCNIKKHTYIQQGLFNILAGENKAYFGIVWQTAEGGLIGFFNATKDIKIEIESQLPDGIYDDLLNSNKIVIKDAKFLLTEPATIFQYKGLLDFKYLIPFDL